MVFPDTEMSQGELILNIQENLLYLSRYVVPI